MHKQLFYLFLKSWDVWMLKNDLLCGVLGFMGIAQVPAGFWCGICLENHEYMGRRSGITPVFFLT